MSHAASATDDFRLEEAVDRLGEGVVVGVAYATLARILQAHGLKDEAAWYWHQAKRMAKVR